MARPVYSVPFLAVQGLSGNSPTITVPVGRVYVVKQLTWYSNPLLGTTRGFFRDLDSGATLFSAATQAGVPFWAGFYGQLVFPQGKTFRWEASAVGTDGVDVYAGGYDLGNF